MNIEKILIIDKDNGEAGEYSFSNGANLLVSKTNSQGKSSLIKTMYYGLGLGITQFPRKWNPTKMIIRLNIYNERTGEHLYIIRVGDLFYVKDISEGLDLKEYTRWLSEQLGVDMKLPLNKVNMTKPISYPSALIIPFYVDQDVSWSKKIFSTTNDIQMYRDIPKSIFNYVLNITDDKELIATQVIKGLTLDKKRLEIKRESVNEIFIDYIETNPEAHEHEISAIKKPHENNQKNIELFISLMDDANKKFIKDKATRIKLQRDLDQFKKTAEEYSSILKMLDCDYDYIKSVCKHCNSELTEEQIATRMGISTDIFELNQLISIANHDIKAAQEKLANAINNEAESSKEYERLAQELETNTQINSIADYIEEASKKKFQEEFAEIIRRLDSEIGILKSDIKDKTKEKREAVKESKELLEKIQHSYLQCVNELTFMMKGSNVNEIDFMNFNPQKSSGVDGNQTYLGIYLAYMRLLSEYGRYKMPFCIDSFIKNETADEKLFDMFEALERYLLGYRGQSIFSAVEQFAFKYMKQRGEFNIVKIGEKLLAPENFKERYEEVKSIVILSNE